MATLLKDADKHIIKHLKGEGRLVQAGTLKHSYPFCWRSETPLIYRAIPSWFMRVSQMQVQSEQLYMAVWVWYLDKSDLTSVGYCTRVY